MIRPFTFICVVIAAGSGLSLYAVKHDAQMLDRQTQLLDRTARDSRSRAALLRAEYDRLGDPDRLSELAAQVLTLQPTDPKQFVSMAELERRLPAVAPPPDLTPADPTPADPTPAGPASAGPGPSVPPPGPAAQLVATLAEPPVKPPAPIRALAATPRPVAQPHPPAPKPAPPVAPASVASVAAVQPSPGQQRPLIARATAAEWHPSARPPPPPSRPVYAGTHVAPPPELIVRAAPVIGSSLGMARTMTMTPVASPIFGAPQR